MQDIVQQLVISKTKTGIVCERKFSHEYFFTPLFLKPLLPLAKPVNTSRLLTSTGAKMSVIFAKIRDEENDQLTGTKFR